MGGGFQFIDIILFAMIAAFLVLRLRSVLGRRDGHEGGHRDPFAPPRPADKAADAIVQLPDRSAEAAAEAPSPAPPPADTPLAAGIGEIHALDPGFDAEEFVIGARVAFEMILAAFAAGDRKSLRSLLSAEVFANFGRAMDERERAGQALEETLVGIKSAEMVEAYLSGRLAHVTIKFVSEQIHVVRGRDGEVVEGDPHAIVQVTDFWTFSRNPKSRDPNWTLVATRSLD